MMHWFNNKKDWPEFYRLYDEKIKDTPQSGYEIALDMETNGMDVKKAEVISYGSVLLNNNTILPHTEKHLLFEQALVNEQSLIIHEIVDRKGEQTMDEALPEVLNNISNHTILGHYVNFDIGLVNAYLRKLKLPRLRNKKIDTLEWALSSDGVKDLNFAKREDYTLYALCERFGIPIDTTHDALADAYLTALLYLHLKR